MHEYLISKQEVDEITSGNEIEYWQADVRHNFKPHLDNYDAIVADIQFTGPLFELGLDRIQKRINLGGILVLASLD